jgi:membrane protease subunit HflC
MSVFVVDEREHALKFQLGEIVRADYEPGLHFKWPFFQNVAKFPNRILNFEDSEARFLTGEQKNLLVDYFAGAARVRRHDSHAGLFSLPRRGARR